MGRAIVAALLVGLAFSAASHAQDEEKEIVSALTDLKFPVGLTLPFAGVDTPLIRQSLYESGWLFADGCSLDERDFLKLWLLVRDKYGAAPAGRFRIPDLRGRVPMGAGTGDGLTPRSVGEEVGEESHKLRGTELPEHKHRVSGSVSPVVETHCCYNVRGLPATDGEDHSHKFDVVSAGIQQVEAGAPANVMQPSLTTNFLVFYGKRTSGMPKQVTAACTP